MNDPIDDLEDAIDAAKLSGGEVSLPLEVAVALRNRLRPMKPWGADSAADNAAELARQAQAESDSASKRRADEAWTRAGEKRTVTVVRVDHPEQQ